MNTCPCCSNQLLRHARCNGVYWFCPHCWQEMPVFAEIMANRLQGVKLKSRFTGRSDLNSTKLSPAI